MFRFCIIITSLLFFHPQAFPQRKMSLQEAMSYGISNNRNLKITQAEVLQSEQKVREVLALGLPQVNASGTFNHFLNLPTTVIPANAFNPAAPSDELIGLQFGTTYAVTGQLQVTQLLFDGSYLVGLQASKNFANLSRLSLDRKENEVSAEITKAYYTAVVADENLKTLQSTLAALEKLFAETKAIKTAGLGDQQDVDQFSLTVSNLKTTLARATLMRDVAYMGLKLQLGMSLDSAIVLSESLESIITVVDMESLSGEIFNPSSTVEYQLLQSQVRLTELSLKNEKVDYYPSVGAFFSHQYQAFRNDFDFFADKPWYPATIWGLQLNIPVFSSGMRTAKVEQARVEVKKSQLTLEETTEALRLQANIVKTEFLNALDAYKLAKESLELARSIEQKTLIKFREGVESSMQVTQAQNQYLAQQGHYVNSMFALLSAKAELDKIFNHYIKQK